MCVSVCLVSVSVFVCTLMPVYVSLEAGRGCQIHWSQLQLVGSYMTGYWDPNLGPAGRIASALNC